MYFFIYYLSRDPFLSTVSSVIFVFNPYVLSHFPSHLILITVGWIPLIFLFFEKYLYERKQKYLLFFFIFLSCQLISSLYYSAYLSILLPIYIVVRLIFMKTNPRIFINKTGVIGFIIFFVIAIGSSILYSQAILTQYNTRNTTVLRTYSPKPIDLIINPKTQNPFLDKLDEKTYYITITTIFLFVISFVSLVFIKSSNNNKNYYFLIFILLSLCILLSFGPTIEFSKDIRIPNICNLIYSVDPLFKFLRVPTRIGVFIFFFLAISISIGLKKLLEVFNYKLGIIGILILMFFSILEFFNLPVEFTNTTEEQRNFFKIVDSQKNIQVIEEYPFFTATEFEKGQVSNYNSTSHYLLWASMFHSKKLFNGDSGFIPNQYMSRISIINSLFPSDYSLTLLRKYGVDGIVIENNELASASVFSDINNMLKFSKAKLVIKTQNYAFYDITKIK